MIPPLRERPEDLEALIRLFYEGRGVDPGAISGANLERLMENRWRGNARELRNVLERAWVLSGGARFEALRISAEPARPSSGESGGFPSDLFDPAMPFKEAKERWNAEFERRYLAAVFERAGGNVTRAAEYAGVHRRHLRELLVRYGLKDE
jgi:DNA-binding NtrC family response regulator